MKKKAVRPYVRPALSSMSEEDLIESLGPAYTQYSGTPVTEVAEGCLLLTGGGDTQQDNWTFDVGGPNPVRISVDSINVAGMPTPLDPKFAIYPPGVTPSAGPFNGYSHADCAGSCIVFDGMACSEPGLAVNACPTLAVHLDTAGTWTLSIAPDVGAPATGSAGCYRITIEGTDPPGLTPLAGPGGDHVVTFLRR